MKIDNERQILSIVRSAVSGCVLSLDGFVNTIGPLFEQFMQENKELDEYKGWCFDLTFIRATVYPPDPKGNPCYASACGGAASSRFLIVGAVGPPNRNRPPAARHYVFYRPPAGAPRQLRPRSARLLVERYAHDRTAVVMMAIVCWQQSL